MIKKFFFCVFLILINWSAGADDLIDKLVRQSTAKFEILERMNLENNRNGNSHLNNYVIELDPNWIEERPQKIILSSNFERLGTALRNFNNARKDMLRFYVVVVNDYKARVNEEASINGRNVISLQDYVSMPDKNVEYQRFLTEMVKIPSEISKQMASKGYTERIVYFYGRIGLYKLDQQLRYYRKDFLSLEGTTLHSKDAQLREMAVSDIATGEAGANKIEKLIANLINGVQVIIDSDAVTATVDCSKSFVENIRNSESIRAQKYQAEVNAIAQLLDTRGPSEPVIYAKPEDFQEMGLFTKQVLKERVALLAGPGISAYKLFVVFKPISFLMPRSDWAKFAQDVYNKSTFAKSSSKNLIMVVPYVYSVCTGSDWLGSVSVGTGMVMPAVYSADSEASLRTSMNSALALTGITWEQNFNQAFSLIPKKHFLLKYAISYDFLTKRYNTVTSDGSGHSSIYELQIIVDSRLQTNIEAKRALDRNDNSREPLPSITATNEAILRELPKQSPDPYLLRHGLKESVLALSQGGLCTDAEQFVRWFVSGKAAEYAGSGWAAIANAADQSTNSPADEKFIAGVNPVRLENLLAAVDAAGMILNFAELDWITDGAGFIIASYYSDPQNKVIYGASLAIPISAYMIKVAAKRAKILKKKMSGEWELVEETFSLAKSLTGDVKSTFDQLIAKGIQYTDDGSTITFYNKQGISIGLIEGNKFKPKKWTQLRNISESDISSTADGYYLVRIGDDYAFNIGYKEGRVLRAEEVNAYYKGIGKHEPYKPGTPVIERSLQPGDKVYVVENQNGGVPSPGGWGSKNKISSEKELRDYLAVLESWKKNNGATDPLVVREYTVTTPIRVRDGVIGPQQEISGVNINEIYYGGEQQYEFCDYPGNGAWKSYFANTPIEYILK